MKRLLLLFSTTIIYFSCQQNSEKSSFGTLVLSDSTTLYINEEIAPVTHSMQYSDGFIYWWNQNRGSITRLDLKDQSQINFLNYDYEGPNGVGTAMGFHIFNEDSILIPKGGNHLIYLINKKGEILNQYDYYTDSIDLSPAISFSTFGVNFKSFGKKIIALNQSYRPEFSTISEARLKEYYPFIEIDLQNSGSRILPFQLSNSILQENQVQFGTAFWIRDKFIYAKHYDSRILYEFNLENYSTKEYVLESNLLKNYTNDHLAGASMMDLDTFQRKYYQTAKTFAFAYDSHQKIYYEFGWPGAEISSDKPLTNIARYLPYYVINIYNDEFKLIGEYKTPRNTYLPHLFFIDENGLNLFANHPDRPNAQEDVFEIHSFKYID